jgi:hypothetical protein
LASITLPSLIVVDRYTFLSFLTVDGDADTLDELELEEPKVELDESDE